MSTPEIVEGDRITKLMECLAKQEPLERKVVENPTVEEEPETEAFELEYSAAELKTIERDKIILESAANKGSSIPEIYEILREKGFSVCQKTIWTVLHSNKAAKYLEVLEQAQDRDIALLRAYALQDRRNPNLKALAAAIYARERRIQRLMPQAKSDVNVEVNVANKAETKVMIDLSKMSQDDREALFRAEEALTRAETAAGPK
jgi:hypothetical protein